MSQVVLARQLLARLQKNVDRPVHWLTLVLCFRLLMQVSWIAALAYLLASSIGQASLQLNLWVVCAFLGLPILIFVLALLESRLAVLIRKRLRAAFTRDLTQAWQTHLAREPSANESAFLVEPLPAFEGYFLRYLPQRFAAVLVPLAILIVVFSLDWIAGLFLLFSAPLIPLFMAIVGMGAERLNQNHFETLRRVSSVFIDRVRNITTLRLFSSESWAHAEIARASEKYREITMKTLRVAFLSSAVLEFFTAVAIAAVAIYVGFSLLGFHTIGPAENMTWLAGLTVLMLAPEFFQPIRTFANYYHDRAGAIGAAADVMSVITLTDDEVKPRNAVVIDSVEVSNLNVGYGGQSLALKPVSFSLSKGQCLLIQGASGLGKSTLLKTVAGLIPSVSGVVQFGALVQALPSINYLAQAPTLVGGSLRDNLQLAGPTATDNDCEKALSDAGLGALLRALPIGLNTQIGEGGFGLSGGEVKRLALARALLSGSNVVVWDEPTASLDDITAAEIIALVATLKEKGMIIIIASHDSNIEGVAEQVIRLEEFVGSC
ncbi:MAG: ABC-type thiol reductant export system component CydD [Idiomarinaceae bacterium HL-53]|nr:MAG: ABC-type thiol reductant export system component CydD [Idiomarinaceae bacterium HL-53]CUS48878.1 ATP-binding cassette, subfamily C, CydD [Idiomarinaceae bacterium HL-53]